MIWKKKLMVNLCRLLNRIIKLVSKSKILILILAICIVVPVVFIEFLSNILLEHDCTSIVCSSCLLIEAVKIFLNTLRFTVIFLCIGIHLMFFIHSFVKNRETISCLFSPILLKVRFNS